MSESPSTSVADAEAALRHLVQNRDLLESLARTQTRDERTVVLQGAGLRHEYPAAELALAVMAVIGSEVQDALTQNPENSGAPKDGNGQAGQFQPERSMAGTILAGYGVAAGTGCLIAAAALA